MERFVLDAYQYHGLPADVRDEFDAWLLRAGLLPLFVTEIEVVGEGQVRVTRVEQPPTAGLDGEPVTVDEVRYIADPIPAKVFAR